nr:cysteine methyltransferase [Actinomycetota bacterium]
MTTGNRDNHQLQEDAANLFAGAAEASPADLRALRHRLTGNAEAAGILDVAYRTLDTPVGTLLLAATPTGLVRVAYDSEGLDAILEGLAARVSPRILKAPRRLDETAGQLEEYFAGRRHRFDLPLDLSLS